MPEKRVLLLVMPFLTLPRPHLGVALLKAGMARQGMSCDIAISVSGLPTLSACLCISALPRDRPRTCWWENSFLHLRSYGEDARPFADFKASVADYVRPYPEDYLRQLDAHAISPRHSSRNAQTKSTLVSMTLSGSPQALSRILRHWRWPRRSNGAHRESLRCSAGPTLNPRWEWNCTAAFLLSTWFAREKPTRVFPELVRRIRAGVPLTTLGGVNLPRERRNGNQFPPQTFVTDLNELPYPDHSDYYQALQNSTAANMWLPRPPWKHRGAAGGDKSTTARFAA